MSQQLTFDLNVDNQQAISAINTFFDAFDAGVKNAGQMLDKQFGQKNQVIGIKLEGGKAVAAEMENMSSIGNKLEVAAKALNGEYGKTPKAVRSSIAVLKEMLSTTHKYKKGTKDVTDEWKLLVDRLKEARKQANDLKVNEGFGRSITGANIAAGLALDGIRALGNGVANLVKQGIGMEVLMIQLKGFTGSTEAATAAFKDYVRIAQATTFNVKQVAEASKIMMGFGVNTEEANRRVEQLAIVATATGGELSHMARNLGQISANQKAYTRDLMQFANQGIPIYQMLGEVLGLNTQQIRELAEDGQIGFGEVTAALDKMTESGSAFRKIAEEMDKTIEARLEALASSITVLAGQFVYAFQEMDKSLGGPFEKSLAALIWTFNKIGEALTFIGNNAEQLKPVVVGLGTAMAITFGIAIVQNALNIAAAMGTLYAKIVAMTVVQNGLNVATAIFQALTGNWAAIAAAAGIAATATYLYTTRIQDATDAQKSLNDELEKEEPLINGSTDAAKLKAFAVAGIYTEQRKVIQGHKDAFVEAQKEYNLKISGAERALSFLEMEAGKRASFHKANIDRIKKEIETEKTGQKEALERAKEAHDIKMEGLNEELQAVRDRYDEELGLLDEETVYAKELREIKRAEIEAKLKSKDLSRKETLELKEQLVQMDRSVKRKELMKQKAEAVEKVQKKITDQEEAQKKILGDINDKYDARISALEESKGKEEEAIKAINEELKAQADIVKQAKYEELQAIYENREAAIESLQAQITEAEKLRKKMVEAYNSAKKAKSEAISAQQANSSLNSQGVRGPEPSDDFFLASGGPIKGGQVATVNELGKEAFLSASGRLSMINAPSWGKWRAPSSGTVIPAHLTKQLNIPAGGINLNRGATAAAAQTAGGGVTGLARAIKMGMGGAGGDTFNQSVTVQSSNPTATANNMMVNMMRNRAARSRMS